MSDFARCFRIRDERYFFVNLKQEELKGMDDEEQVQALARERLEEAIDSNHQDKAVQFDTDSGGTEVVCEVRTCGCPFQKCVCDIPDPEPKARDTAWTRVGRHRRKRKRALGKAPKA